MKYSDVSEDLKKAVIDFHLEGESQEEIAAVTELTVWIVRRIIMEHRVSKVVMTDKTVQDYLANMSEAARLKLFFTISKQGGSNARAS